MPEGEVVVNAPPDVPREVPGNPLSRLLPVVMVVATVGMMVFYFTSGAATRNPMFMLFPVMTLASLLGTVVTGARGGTRVAEINRDRRDYLRYLASLDTKIMETIEQQRESLSWRHPEPSSLWTLIGGTRMWERRREDADFGHVRIGLATQCLSTPLVAPQLGPVEDLDPVTSAEYRRLVRQRSSVPDLPIALGLRSLAAITVSGDMLAARGLLRAVVCQLAVLHSPRDLRIATVVDPLTAGEWDWLKWLPHHQHPTATDGCGSARMTYTGVSSAEAALVECGSGHAVLLVDGSLTASIEGPLPSGALAGVTALQLGTAPAGNAGTSLDIKGAHLMVRSQAGEDVPARPDTMSVGQALACARRMSAFQPAATPLGGAARMSAAVAWSELMGIADVGEINHSTMWRTTRAAEQELRVPIGVSENGHTMYLDIKEAAANGMGPHGLCIGATGSGKSEFLRTLTLGMIAAHPPETLNLVLVDFKGGATFLGFERTHHVAAVITNLTDEAHLVARMRDALAGEMNRRQEQLRAAGNVANIAEYNRARNNDARLPPLPALFIVVDEFSELLSQHPDFIDLFIVIGRLGRSLGMHLLLASQRVDEGRLRGLESHLSYRVCLKTFSAAESRAVLGVPDAYHLPSTPGAAYLKTGSGDPVCFQTAFVSGRYRPPMARSAGEATPRPRLFTAAPTGRIAFAGKPRTGAACTPSRTVLDTVLDRFARRGSPARQVWLPPLAESPALDTLLQRSGPRARLTVPIGVVDRPFEQRRVPLVAQLAGAAGNVAVVGGPRSGKSTVLQTLILALAESHDPRDVQVYCLDFGGGALSALRQVPHVGSVAGRRDVDVVRRTVGQLESLLRARETGRSASCPGARDDRYGDVFLVIDGWAVIRQEFDALEAAITGVAAQGLSYGIHVVVSASRWAEIRPALKDQIGTRIELRLGDPAESEMDRKRARLLIQSPPGRGITRDGHEFVIAIPRFDAAAGELRTRYPGHGAPPVEVLPTRIGCDALIAKAPEWRSKTRILFGLSETELQPIAVDFAVDAHLVILGQGECGKTTTLRTLCREIVRTNTAASAQLFIVDYRRTLLGVVESDHLAAYAPSVAALTPQLAGLLGRLQERMPGADVTQQELRARSWWSGPEIYIVVDDYDLVATPNGVNPLAPLLDFLPHAKDLGLHVVVARRSGGAARGMFDPVLARLRDLGCMGLMMSAGPDEGVLLGTVRPSQLPPGRGTLVTRAHRDQLVQVAWTDPA